MRKLELISDNIAFQWRIQRGAKEMFAPLRERERERERERKRERERDTVHKPVNTTSFR